MVPNLIVEKKVDKKQVNPGDTLRYTIYYSNALSDTAMGVSLVDIFPEKTIFLQDINPGWIQNVSKDSLFYEIGTLAPMDSDSITLKLIVMDENQFSSGFHNLLNVVEIRDKTGRYKNKDAVISKLFLLPDVYVQKRHQPKFINTLPNTSLRYIILVGNNGNHSAENLVINDTLTYLLSAFQSSPLSFTKNPLKNSQIVPDTVLSWVIPSIAPGDSFEIILDTKLSFYDLFGIDMLLNRVAVILKDDQNLKNNYFRDTTYFWGGGGIAIRDLIVEKTDNKDSANINDTLTYVIKFKNAGILYTRDTKIQEYFPSYENFIDFQFVDKNYLHSYNMTTDGMEWYLKMLAPGDSGSIKLKFSIPDTLPLGKNVLIDSVLINSSTLGEVNYKNNKAVDTTIVYGRRDLEIKKTDNIDSISPGGVLTYEIQYWNKGNLLTRNPKIVEYFPALVKYREFKFEDIKQLADSSLYPDRIEWTLNALSPNDSGKITLIFNVPDSIPIGRFSLIDSIKIGSLLEEENNYNNNKSIDTTLLKATRDIYVDRKSTRLNSSHTDISRMPSSA